MLIYRNKTVNRINSVYFRAHFISSLTCFLCEIISSKLQRFPKFETWSSQMHRFEIWRETVLSHCVTV
jgi:hypothetical protein